MLLLIDDKVQISDAPAELKSPALADYYSAFTTFDIDIGSNITVNCIGIGYTDATQLTITTVSGLNEVITIAENGLYELPETTDDIFSISHDGTYVGRIALGYSRSLGIAPTREAGFYSTESNRITTAGGVIPGAGGYYGKRIAIDARYKIDSDIVNDFENAYEYISKGYPFFMKFTTKEQVRIPFTRLYASTDDPNILLQSSVNRFLYSKQFDFYERF